MSRGNWSVQTEAICSADRGCRHCTASAVAPGEARGCVARWLAIAPGVEEDEDEDAA